jgi:hypothetical protein
MVTTKRSRQQEMAPEIAQCDCRAHVGEVIESCVCPPYGSKARGSGKGIRRLELIPHLWQSIAICGIAFANT